MEFLDSPLAYPALKWIHILSATFLFGTGVGSAFYKFVADRGGNLQVINQINRYVVLADWLFTMPTFIIQPVSGVMLALLVGYPLGSSWLLASMVLYVFLGLFWFPVVAIQIRMSRMSGEALAAQTTLGKDYGRLVNWWVSLGVLAFIAMIAIYYLMIFKPVLWA